MTGDWNQAPWSDAPEVIPCNLAFGRLVANLPHCLIVDGRIHAETYISAVGAIAGYAAQRTLLDRHPPAGGNDIIPVETRAGRRFWFGEALTHMLVSDNVEDATSRVWSQAAGSAVSAGMRQEELPALEGLFEHVSATIGADDEGRSSVPAQHQAQMPARELLKAIWPFAAACFSGEGGEASCRSGSVPTSWWSAIAARAASKPIHDVKNVLPLDIALTLLMESAIYCSKLDQTEVEEA